MKRTTELKPIAGLTMGIAFVVALAGDRPDLAYADWKRRIG